MAFKGGKGGGNGEVDFLQNGNDARGDKADVGMGLPEFNDFRGAVGGAQGGPLFNEYRQLAPQTGDVMSVMWDRPIGAGGGGQGGRKRRRG